MNDASRQDRLTELTHGYLEHLETGAPAPDLSRLPEDERADAEEHLRLVRALWSADNYEVPTLEEDPVAIRFGFDRISPTLRVSGLRIREARQAAGLATSALATELAERGHGIDRAELGALERASHRNVPIELASAMAAVLATSVNDLEAPEPMAGARMGADDFATHPVFLATVTRWADRHHVDARSVASRQRERLLQIRHRGAQEMTAGEWRELLLELLRADAQ